ncbi:MAG: PRD domain-containing protein [Erysipelotrichaceae bacterium]|nr:PRD domain-containing protein [Erysipelotrichaceae bacterium]
MQEIHNRDLRLIYHIVEAGKPITSQKLSEIISVSPRTVKSDMANVREIMLSQGVELISTKSMGYTYKILDESKFRPFYDQLMYNSVLLGTFVTDRMARFIHIARTLVASNTYIKLDDLADNMYLSRSSIKAEIKQIYSFFNSYHLQVDSKIGHGIKIIGAEFNLRMAMTELVVNHYHKIKVNESSPEFAHILRCTEEERQRIRHAYLKVLRESGISSTDSETLRLAFYLLITRNRRLDGYKIILEEEIRLEAQSYPEYSVAVDVAKALNCCDDFNLDEDETAYIAILFHCTRDLCKSDIKEDMQYLQEATVLSSEIIDRINSIWEIDFRDTQQLHSSLITILLPILSQIRFGISTHQSIGNSITNQEIEGCPLSMELARSTVSLIESKYYSRINTRSLINLAYCFYGALNSIRFEIRKLNLVTVAWAGKETAQELVNRINNRFAPMIATNRPVELYEIRGMDPKTIDCVIMNNPEFSYNYQIPHVMVAAVSRPNQFNILFDEILVNAYQFREFLPDVTKTKIYRNFAFESIPAMFKLIAYKHGKDETNSSLLEEMMIENEKFASYNSMDDLIPIFLPYNMCNDKAIEIYSLKDPVPWSRGEISTIVVFIADFSRNPQITKVYENISRMMMVTKEPIMELLEKPSEDVYVNMIKACLTSE